MTIFPLPFNLPDDLSNVNKTILEKETPDGTFEVIISTITPCYPSNRLPSLGITLRFVDKDGNAYYMDKEEDI